jgi:hypothetical protein
MEAAIYNGALQFFSNVQMFVLDTTRNWFEKITSLSKSTGT